MGEQGRLVEAAAEESCPMQRHGDDEVRIGEERGSRAAHPLAEGGCAMEAVVVLQRQNETAAAIVIAQRRAGAVECRRRLDAGAAERVRAEVVGERQSAAGAAGLAQERDL